MFSSRCISPFLLIGILLGCGGAAPRVSRKPATQEIVQMEELRITANRGEGGEYDFQVYDATELFERATALLQKQKCNEAVILYDRLVREFSSSRFVSASLYNSGLCLQESGKLQESVAYYTSLLQRLPNSPDVTHALFQLVQVLLTQEDWEQSLGYVEQLLAREGLSPEERIEAMAYRAKALFGSERLDEAEHQARSSLSYYRTRPEDKRIRDEFFVAASNFILAESIRMRGQMLRFPVGGVEEQREVLIRKAELLLEAQREYFNTIYFKIAKWAAASGYRIGQMYDELWQSLMDAPIPDHLTEEGHEIYRMELAKLIKPLLRHSIRYWELTLMLIERTGLQSEWTQQTKMDLERVRERLLDQPIEPGEQLEESN